MDNNFVSQHSDETDDDIVNKILGNVSSGEDYSEVRLPSLATNLYDVPSDVINIRGMTFEDEKVIATLKDKSKVMDVLIERCVKENINAKQLIPQDKVFLMMHLRAMSVGPKYNFSVNCPKCEKKSEIELDVLDTFPCKYPEEPLQKVREISLPMLQKNVTVKRASSSELDALGTAGLLTNLWRFVLSIDGHTNARIRAKVIDKLPREDIREIIKIITSEEVGLETRFMFGCSFCGHEELTEFEFHKGFFTMT